MAKINSVEILNCTSENRFRDTIVDLKKSSKIGFPRIGSRHECDNSGIGEMVALRVNRRGNTTDQFGNKVAKVIITCPKFRCPHHT